MDAKVSDYFTKPASGAKRADRRDPRISLDRIVTKLLVGAPFFAPFRAPSVARARQAQHI
jgi:hypothetical protein